MADSKHANATSLDTFLEGSVANFLGFSKSNDEVQVLCQLVHEIVFTIVTDASLPDVCGPVRKFIHVGSMADGTRIGSPDEFDFMLVMDKFDANDIDSVISNEHGTFLSLKPEGRLENCSHSLKKPDHSECDFETFLSKKICVCEGAVYLQQMKLLSLRRIRVAVDRMIKDDRSCLVECFPGRLRVMKGFKLHGPAITINLLWETFVTEVEKKSMNISVDLVEVTEVEINAFFLDRLDVFHKDFCKNLRYTNRIHIFDKMTKDEFKSMFPVSFALTEIETMRDETEIHKNCYRLLKYIYTRKKTQGLLCEISSFELKNLVLQHSVLCKDGGLGRCFLKILCDLMGKMDDQRTETAFIPHIFSTKKNVLHFSWLIVLWTDHRDKLSAFIQNLEKCRYGTQIMSSLKF